MRFSDAASCIKAIQKCRHMSLLKRLGWEQENSENCHWWTKMSKILSEPLRLFHVLWRPSGFWHQLVTPCHPINKQSFISSFTVAPFTPAYSVKNNSFLDQFFNTTAQKLTGTSSAIRNLERKPWVKPKMLALQSCPHSSPSPPATSFLTYTQVRLDLCIIIQGKSFFLNNN